MRKQYLRVGSLLVALTFQGVAWADGMGLHACPLHDAVPATAPEGAPAPAPATAHHGHSVHHAPDGDAHQDGHAGPCTCVGTCGGGGDLPLATVLPSGQPLGSSTRSSGSGTTPDRELPGPPAFLLPYSQGPPPLA